MNNFNERFNESLILVYDFIRNPFHKPIDHLDNDKSLVFVASILSGFTVIVRTLNHSEFFFEPWMYLLYISLGLLITPIFGFLIVHFKGAILHLFLKHIASPILKTELNNVIKAKQIETFATIGLIVSAVPSLSNVGIVIGIVIQILGIYRLFKIDLIKSAIVGILYHALWWGFIYLIAKGTVWI
jgi:hypothetical protein